MSRMKSFKARKEAISTPFYHWCGYVRYWLATKARLQYVVAMAKKGALTFTLQVWSAHTKYVREIQRGLTRCLELQHEILILFDFDRCKKEFYMGIGIPGFEAPP